MEQKFPLVFAVMFLGYTSIVYNRQSIPYAAPIIAEGENLQNSDLGVIISSQHLGYMIVKTMAGPMADVVSLSLLLWSSLFLTGLTLASFTAASSVLMFSVASFLCGFVQRPSWGACAVLLKQLVEPQQFATWWGILSVSTNVAGTVGLFLSAFCVESYGCRSAFLAV
ncbi:glucose-6-phosphate translocase [Elysia marginata]|uniref:Glucose-6-phosphate translocase n=1 Tax=Elysia marginata TaxID=1093978 RepID=A0AAV4EAS3_9GAST|nr:glucose-6-phosphate translocase [Elysia marginata]